MTMIAALETEEHEAVLEWTVAPAEDHARVDRHRVTEDAADAVSLVLVHVAHGWVVRRRLARGEAADWLLADPGNGLVALEVSGIDKGVIRDRLREKLRQAGRATAAPRRFASVIELGTPRAALAAVAGE